MAPCTSTMSTVSTAGFETVRDAAQARPVGFIAAPVSSSTVLAEKAQLTVFASGPKAAFERARPVFEAFSARQYYVGADQAGALSEARHQPPGRFDVAVLLAEALTLGQKAVSTGSRC